MALLQISGLTHYFGGLRAVYDFDLTLDQGELIGLIGPNGAGKTTVFNLITGIYRPSEGVIQLDGQPIIGLQPHRIAAQGVCRTFQTIRLFSDVSVLDNVKIAFYSQIQSTLLESLLRAGRSVQEDRAFTAEAMRLLELFGVDGYAHELARNLPYGEQRRVEIVRALATKPRLLLLDEPAAGMNPGEIDHLMDLIHYVRDQFKLTIFLIEHQMRLVMRICERIKVMDFGATIAEGTPDEVRNNPQVLKAYLGEEVEE
jgi:branched-chain amino acid transport system ATP-binding protein